MSIIIGVGDIMPGGMLSGVSQKCVDDSVMSILQHGNIIVGTLECAFGNEPTYDEAKVSDRGNVIYAKDNDVRRLKELHVDIVSLANNHFFDLGPKGAEHTIELLNKEGVLHCGAGKNLKEAGEPAVIEVRGKKFAFLAFCDINYNNVYYCTYATENTPGVNPMEEEYVFHEIKENAKKYDYVVVLAHWGSEHTFYPNVSSYKMARKMQKAGADLVLGSHPHRIQPVINSKHGSIAYSMGNFLFPERLIAPPKVTYYSDTPLDYSELPITDQYPIVDRVTIKTLPFLARVGMIVESTIEDDVFHTKFILTYLNKDNRIELLVSEKCISLQKKLSRLSIPLKWNFYPQFVFCRKVLRHVLRRIKQLFKRKR